jgi:hypothetical protein
MIATSASRPRPRRRRHPGGSGEAGEGRPGLGAEGAEPLPAGENLPRRPVIMPRPPRSTRTAYALDPSDVEAPRPRIRARLSLNSAERSHAISRSANWYWTALKIQHPRLLRHPGFAIVSVLPTACWVEANRGDGRRKDRQGSSHLRPGSRRRNHRDDHRRRGFIRSPVSTTHVLSSAVGGTMAANGSGLQWGTVRNLLMAGCSLFLCPSSCQALAGWFDIRR